jgi:hypothetical protein
MAANTAMVDGNGKCWVSFSDVSDNLLKEINAETLGKARAKGPRELAAMLASLRRDTVEKPVILSVLAPVAWAPVPARVWLRLLNF